MLPAGVRLAEKGPTLQMFCVVSGGTTGRRNFKTTNKATYGWGKKFVGKTCDTGLLETN
jgi:hypothetical protein